MKWQEQELPPLRTGNVWGMRIYPGGRKVVQQVSPERMMYVGDAVEALIAGNMAMVWLDDAALTVSRWNEEKELE